MNYLRWIIGLHQHEWILIREVEWRDPKKRRYRMATNDLQRCKICGAERLIPKDLF